jgi:hypothetical protein
MNLVSNIYEKIDIYLEGKLSGEELMNFENELNNNDSLKNKVETLKLTNELLVDFKLNELKNRINQDLKNLSTENNSNGKNYLKYFVLVGLVTLSGLGYLFLNKSDESDKIQIIQKELFNKTNNLVKGNENSTFNSIRSNVQNSKVDLNKPTQNSVIVNSIEIVKNDAATDLRINTFFENPTPTIVSEPLTVERNINQNIVREINTNTNPCIQEKIKANIIFEASCVESPSGVIKVEKVENGNSPYVYSIDHGKDFKEYSYFNNLHSGEYHILIKDKFGCLSDDYKVVIESKVCSKAKNEFAFSPSLNETFKFPIEQGEEGNIQIFTRSGQKVFTTNFSDTQEWNGISNTGFGIEAGVYVFVIESKSGKLQKGYITLY